LKLFISVPLLLQAHPSIDRGVVVFAQTRIMQG
jgi:hypothetical protein